MESDALLHPRGPLPAAVYWRRRLVTFGVLVVVLLLVARSCAPGGSPAAKPTPAPTHSTSPRPSRTTAPSGSPSASPSGSPIAAGPCAATDLVLSARADKQAYPAGAHPVLTIGIANKGAKPCTRDVGQGAREIRVTSGNDRVWSSDDCSPGGGAQVVTLRPGAAPVTFTVTWSRRRSAPGCPTGERDAAPGTYRVTGRFGDLTSSGDTFRLG